MKSRCILLVALLAGAVSVFCVTSPARAQYAGNGTPLYLDLSGNTLAGSGFEPSPNGTYSMWNNSPAIWTLSNSGGGTITNQWTSQAQMTFGAPGYAETGTFTINFNSAYYSTVNGIVLNSAGLNVTLNGTGAGIVQTGGASTTWYVAAGSSLTEAVDFNGLAGAGMNFIYGGQPLYELGGGTLTWGTAIGYSGGAGQLITQGVSGASPLGPVVNIAPSTSGGAGLGGYALLCGTLNFANSNSFANLPTTGTGKLTISDTAGLGVIDNTSGSAGTLSNIGGGIAISGSFSFLGSSPLSFGTSTGTLNNNPVITVLNGSTLTIPCALSGTGSLTLGSSSTGTLLLSGINTYSGNTLVSGGTLLLGNASALAGSTLDTSGTGTFSFGALTAATVAGLANTGGSLALNNATPAGVTLSVGNNGASSTYSGALSGSGGLTKIGAGTLTLTATTGGNTYTGATTVNAGTLNLNFAAAGAPALSIIGSSSALVLGGGNLTLTGSASATNSQTFNGLNLASAASQITLNLNSASGLLLSLGTLTSNAGSTVNFTLPTGTQSATNGITTSNPVGFLGAWATVNGTDWATVNGTNNIVAIGSYVQTSAAGTTAGNYSGADIDVNNSAGLIGGTISADSIRFNTAAACTLTLAAGNNTIASGGILETSTVGVHASTITGGTLESGGQTFLVTQNNTGSPLTINSAIADNGAPTGLFKGGAGTLVLGGTNTFSGGTTINAGLLQLGNNSALGATTGGLTLNGAGVLDIHGYRPTIGALSGIAGTTIESLNSTAGTLTTGSATSTTFAGVIAPVVSQYTFTGCAVGLVQNGPGTLTLTGTANCMQGNVTINGGTLQIGNGGVSGSLQYGNGNPNIWPFTTANGPNNIVKSASNYGITVNSGAALVYNQASTVLGNPISGSGTVYNMGATGGLVVLGPSIAMTGTGGFTFNTVGGGIGTGDGRGQAINGNTQMPFNPPVSLSVVNGVGTINSSNGYSLASVCRKKDVFAGEGRPAGLVTGWNTRSIASRRRLISLGMP